jgi:tetratricopeptide (TPR) repeat protein
VPHFYRSADEFAAAAQAAVAAATPRQPVALVVAELDPPAGTPAGTPDGATGAARPTSEFVIGAVFELVRHALRADDLVGRMGDRIVTVLIGAAAEDARWVGERICAAVRMHTFAPALPSRSTTLSIGVSAAPEHGATFDALHGAAGAALVRLQAQGRDGVAVAPLPHHEALHRTLATDRLAGRTQELASLVKWLDEASAGQPRIVALFGETGTGTAMLLRQLEPEVRSRGGTFLMAASADTDVRQPYGVWAGLLAAASRLPAAPRSEWFELPHLAPSLAGGTPHVSTTGSQYRLLGELTHYFRTLAADRPMVLVLDEMQWADGTSWDALEHLLGQLDTDRLLVCVAQQPESAYDTSPHRQMLARHDIVRELSLSALTRDEVKQWLEAAFHQQQVAREFLAFLYRHTEGNPLFIRQLLRSLIEDGALWHNGTRWEWTPVSELRLPAGRRALIAQRVGRFSSSTQAVLGTAALVGRQFDVALLVASGAGSEAAVRLAISEAVVAGMLRPTYERRQGGFTFVHEEISGALVDLVPQDRLRQLHQRVAQAMERRLPDRAGDIAMHYDQAGASADAYKWAQRAAAMADRLYAPAASSSYLQLGVRNATTPAELAEIRVALAHVAETGGRFDEVEELCDLAIEWFGGQSDERRALTLRRMRERARMELGQPAKKTLDALIELDNEAMRLGFDRERVAILTMASQTHGRLGDQRTAERVAAEGVEMAEAIGDPGLLGDALNRLGNTIVSESPGKAHANYQRALELLQQTGDVRGQARCYGNLGIAAQFEGRLDEAVQAFGRAITVARSAGMPDLWGVAALNLGVLSQKFGDYDRARELFGEALALFAAVKHSEYQLAALYNMAHVERELGLWESASELYEATTPLARRIGQADIETGAIAGAAICYLELGRMDSARAASKELAPRVETRPDWFQNREMTEALFVRMAVLEGRPAEAVERFKKAVNLAESADLYCAAWLTAACADALGDIDRTGIEESIQRYSDRVKTLGYPEMTRRYDSLMKR